VPYEQDAAFESRVRESFARQTFMTTLGARLTTVEPGCVAIEMPYRDDLTQQHAFVHGGVIASLADSACGYAAMTLMPTGVAVLSVEFKVNLMAPAAGLRFRATAKVIRPGRTLTVCNAEVHAERDGGESVLIALMQATIMAVRDRPGLVD
jgi:uncharacterized protein (TIGR00369 family)